MAHKHDPIAFATREQKIQAAKTAITRLQQIQAAASPTNAQVIAAIRDMALYDEHVIRIIVAGV